MCLQEIPRERLGSNTGHSKTKTKIKILSGRHPGSAGEVFTMTLKVRSMHMSQCSIHMSQCSSSIHMSQCSIHISHPYEPVLHPYKPVLHLHLNIMIVLLMEYCRPTLTTNATPSTRAFIRLLCTLPSSPYPALQFLRRYRPGSTYINCTVKLRPLAEYRPWYNLTSALPVNDTFGLVLFFDKCLATQRHIRTCIFLTSALPVNDTFGLVIFFDKCLATQRNIRTCTFF